MSPSGNITGKAFPREWPNLKLPARMDLGPGYNSEDDEKEERIALARARDRALAKFKTISSMQAKTSVEATFETRPRPFPQGDSSAVGSIIPEAASDIETDASKLSCSTEKPQVKSVAITPPPSSSLDDHIRAGRDEGEHLSLNLDEDEKAGAPNIPHHQESSSLTTFASECVPI